MRLWVVSSLALFVASGAARADVITTVTTQAGLDANDSVDWSQFGGNGTAIGQYFRAVSSNGFSVGGAFAGTGGGQVCASPNGVCTTPVSSPTLSSLTGGAGAGNGMLTFTVPGGVGAVGTEILNPYAAINPSNGNQPSPYTANLTLYNNGTLLGTVTGTSDSNGDPIFLGASDSTGDNITSFSYSIASIGTPEVPAVPAVPPVVEYYAVYYNCSEGNTDPPGLCSNLTADEKTQTSHIMQCPWHTLCPGSGQTTVSVADYQTVPDRNELAYYEAIYNGPGTAFIPAIPSTLDNNPSQIASLLIKSLHLRISRPAPAQAATAAACVGSGAGL